MKTKIRSYSLLFISIMIVGTAITLITNSGLGATAVTSLPFVISELWGIRFGLLTGLFNVLWVILQMLIQRKNFPKIQWLQFFVAFLLGFAVDFSNLIFGFLQPQTYVTQLVMLVFGCLVMGFGITVQLKADTIYNPAEGIVAVISENTPYEFGTVKTVFDSTLFILSVLLGLIVANQVVGIREGTIISAVIIGPFTGIFQKRFNRK